LGTIDTVIEQVIGPRGDRSAEAVARRLSSLSRSDSLRFSRFLEAVPQEESGIIRGSLIAELGRAPSGQQTVEGAGFSMATLARNWDQLPDRTRNLLFRGQHRQDIEDLVRIAVGSREAGRFANRSNTGSVAITTALGAGATALNPQLLLAIAGNYVTGHLLANPRFSRWLMHPPQDRGRALRRLNQIAVREPSLAPDIVPIRQALEGGARPLAAEENEDSR
jgi:hypothetical protein